MEMRKTLSKALIIIFVISGAVFLCRKTALYKSMDTRAESYNIEGDLIVIDSQEGLMSIYHAHEPLIRVWNERLQIIEPGEYIYDSFEDLIELSLDDTDRVYHLYMMEKDLECIRENVSPGTHVVVY